VTKYGFAVMWFVHGIPQGVLHQESPLPTISVNIPNSHGPKFWQGCERDGQLFEHVLLILVSTASQKIHLLAPISSSTVNVLVAIWTSATTTVDLIIVGLATELDALCRWIAFFRPACRAQRLTGQCGPKWQCYPHHLLDKASCKNQAEQYSECFHSGALKFPLSEAKDGAAIRHLLECLVFGNVFGQQFAWVHHFHLVLFL